MIWDYVQENSGIAISQMKRMGASADWERKKFTLDTDIVDKVLNTFIKLNLDGLVYRGYRLVNYCTRCGTAYSELEVNYEEQEDKLYVIDYGPLKVATTRPETMLGDVAVAVNPEDSRYTFLIGNKLSLPLTNREIPIVADEMVDMEFGTGAVKITPAHDQADYEVAQRQGWDMNRILKENQVIGTNGKMTENAGRYKDLSIAEARDKVLADLGEKVIEVKPYKHNVGHCYRCHRIIEPLPMKQFFIRTRPLADKVLEALDKGKVKILGAGREKILRVWLAGLRDWNISRQIVWGIRMPIWYKKQGSDDDYVVSKTSPGEDYIQETDTFDTWFSSGQWPVLTLQASSEGDFDFYYPTAVMETAYDILIFWVMRMLMLGLYLTNEVPFRTVYLHGLVRDEKGQKMSKSKGNVTNPLELVDKYGADALRMALVMSTTPGQDSATGEAKVRGMRNLANKIWNAARFVSDFTNQGDKNIEFEYWYSKRLPFSMSAHLDNLRIGQAAELIYNEFWHNFCDKYIEDAKAGKISADQLRAGFANVLKLLHPFVPFVTEAVWQELKLSDKLLIEESWPHQ